MGLESLEARIVVHENLEEALKEKDDLKLKLEKFEESSKNLTKLINSQISAKDKTGLGYDGQMNESEVIHSVFNSRESDVDDNPVNDRFKTDESVFKSAVRKTTTSVPETDTSISKTSKDIVEKPKTVRPSAPIIEEWDTENDNDSVFRPKSDQTKPNFTKINFVKSGENVKFVNKENTHRQVEYPRKSQSPREKPVLNNKGRVTGQREIRPVWNNAQRVKHQNKLTHPHPKRNFVPTAVATKSGQVPVNAAKQSSPRAAASISTARPVNTDAPKPKVNDALPTTYSYFQAHSSVNNETTARPKAVVSDAEGNRENVVKSSACWIWRPTGNVIDHISKDSGSYMLKRFDYVDLQGRLKIKGFLTVDALGEVRTLPRIPSDLNVQNTTLFQWPDLSLHNLNRFLDEIKIGHRFGGFIQKEEACVIWLYKHFLSAWLVKGCVSPENFHVNPSSIITSPGPVEEEIDIFLVSDDLIPPGVENDDSEDEDNSTSLPDHESPNLDHQDNPSAPRPPLKPPDVKICLEPDTAVINNFDVLRKDACFNLEEDVQPFLPFFTYPEVSPFILSFGSEDLVFDPGISACYFSLKPVPFALPKDK
ncbi:hypothetical protein Tco_0490916 [Tanacetum coccineum]